MTEARTAIACLLACSSLAFASAVAAGQQAVIERCKQTSSKDDRIACLEAALLVQEPVESKQTAPVVPEPSPAPEPTPAVTDATEEVGVEQVVARTQTQEERIAALKRARGLAVAKYDELAHGRLQVTLENGQVWRQIRGDTQTVNATLKKNQTVDISESSLGGYKLRLNEMQRTIRVQRIR